MSTCRGLGQLHPGTDSSKIALEKLYFAASSVDQTGSAATTAAIAVPSLPRGLRHCEGSNGKEPPQLLPPRMPACAHTCAAP